MTKFSNFIPKRNYYLFPQIYGSMTSIIWVLCVRKTMDIFIGSVLIEDLKLISFRDKHKLMWDSKYTSEK